MFLGNVGQQLDIDDLSRAIDLMQSSLERKQNLDQRQERSIEELRQENQELKLYLATLMRLLVAKGVIKQEEVDAAVHAIDKT